jgi:RNA polymerase sigma-70 factor, ECF subfamily
MAAYFRGHSTAMGKAIAYFSSVVPRASEKGERLPETMIQPTDPRTAHTEVTMSIMQQADLFGFATYSLAALQDTVPDYRETYEQNRHRVYSLAFWMTDNELAAEEVMKNTFCRVFAGNAVPSSEEIDRALLTELREYMPVGTLTLECAACNRLLSVRRNFLRVDLERAVVQLPNTEKVIFLMHDVEGYDHARIARILGLTQDQSRHGLHQARLRVRELLAK